MTEEIWPWVVGFIERFLLKLFTEIAFIPKRENDRYFPESKVNPSENVGFRLGKKKICKIV
jgi:hypothetical protein